jgi:HEAT repeat protein
MPESDTESTHSSQARVEFPDAAMKKLAFLFCFVAIVASRAFGGLTQDQLGRFQHQLANSDPKVRLAALEDLQKAHLETAGNNVLPLLSKALRDPDKSVRAYAAAYLAMISFVTSPKFREPAKDKTDLCSYPPLKEDLIATLNDSDEDTRKNALCCLRFGVRGDACYPE